MQNEQKQIFNLTPNVSSFNIVPHPSLCKTLWVVWVVVYPHPILVGEPPPPPALGTGKFVFFHFSRTAPLLGERQEPVRA